MKWLARACLDVNHAEEAKHYLNDLGCADAIPAVDADFEARSHFARWLAHPCELGKPPDEVEIVDRRELSWPPDGKPKDLRLLRYRVKDTTGLADDDVGIGLVGSVTFCFFFHGFEQRPPEDAYAVHCYWEMQHAGLIAECDVPPGSTEYDDMLRQHALPGMGSMRIKQVAELSPPLNYPQRLVALAVATRHGERGWVVLDGARSRWYAAAEMPARTAGSSVLMLHVGRVLLGFADEPNRRTFLRPPTKRPPPQIVAAYERLLERLHASPSHAKKLLESSGPLSTSMDDYAAALAAVRSESKAACTCEVYETLLAAVDNASSLPRWNLIDEFSPLACRNFDSYVNALIALNRQADVPPLIERLRSHWSEHQGYGPLGAAAYRSGHERLAETFLIQLRDSGKNWCRHDEMNLLAEIWCKEGRGDEAHDLLIAMMRELLALRQESTDFEDHACLGQELQSRRSAYLRLFADRGEETLKRYGIPASNPDEPPCND